MKEKEMHNYSFEKKNVFASLYSFVLEIFPHSIQ